VIIINYVLTNRATLLSKGIVCPEFCYQLDEGLLKPDLQIYLKGPPVSLEVKPSVCDTDTQDSRSKLVEAFDFLAGQSEEIKTIDIYSKENWDYSQSSDLAANLTIRLFRESRLTRLRKFNYFNGFN
jgi:hypothetical protein